MKLIEQILSERGGDINNSFTVVLGFGGYFKGIKGVAEYSEQKIVLQTAKKRLTVQGASLAVGEFFEGDMFISGDIGLVQVD